MECCQPELTVGDTWDGSFYLADAEPWWSRYAESPLAPDVRDLGVVEFDGEVLQPAPSSTGAALVALGSARIGVYGATTVGRQHFRGRLDFEGHGGGDPDAELDDLQCIGVVRRVRGIAYGHGTAVAGVIAAENNGSGPLGVAYDAGITGVKVYAAVDLTDSTKLQVMAQQNGWKAPPESERPALRAEGS